MSNKSDKSKKIKIKTAPSDIHLRDSTSAGIAQQVYEQLEEDYKPNLISWVRSAHWEGPMLVPLKNIDFSEQPNWSANDDEEHVQHFVDEITDKMLTKPVILINTPDKKKLYVADGRHRTLAYKKLKMPVLAYVAEVGAKTGEFHDMHEMNEDGENSWSDQK